jgi:hypothetical protein
VPRGSPAADLVREGDRLRRHGRPAEAEAAYRGAVERDPGSVRGHIGLQEIGLSQGRALRLRRLYRDWGDGFLAGRLEADPERQRVAFERASEPWRSLGLAMADPKGRAARHYRRASEFDPGLALARIGHANALLAEGDLGWAALKYDAARWADPEHPAPWLGLSLIEERRGDLRAALRHAREAYRRAPAEESLAERVRELAERAGREPLRSAARLFEAEGGAGEGLALLSASRIAAADGDPLRARTLADRAQAAGITEAEATPARGVPPALRTFVIEFTRAVAARYRHYAATGEHESFPEFHAFARALYERTTGRRLGKAGRPLEYAFVGKLVDPTERTDEPLVADLRRHGLLLVLGQRSGGPPEAMLAALERVEPSARVAVRGVEVEREVLWIGARHVAGYQEWAGGGDLAGLALPGLVIVDLAAVARWEGEILREQARLEPFREEILAEPALEDPPWTAIVDPAGVAQRLCLDGSFDVAREVLKHEEAHLVDADRHLPVFKHPFRNIELAVTRGFSSSDILAYLERNAQLTAIAEGTAPRAALATCCGALGRGGVHASGYTEIVAAFVKEIAARPEAHPEIDPERVIVQQLHRLSDEQIRALARATMREWGVSAGPG